MYQVGRFASLAVIRQVAFGFYLNGQNLGDILLPNRHSPTGLKVGDEISVFLYYDSEDRVIATQQKPKVQVDECAYLKVIAVNAVGAFLDWGLDKDLLVPFGCQNKPLVEGQNIIVQVGINELDGRILGRCRLDGLLMDYADDQIIPGQKVNCLVAQTTDLGYKVIINHRYWGLIHKNQSIQPLSYGQSLQAYIQTIREDGRIDVCLNHGIQSRDKDTLVILNALRQGEGALDLHDKSDPQAIVRRLKMSKARFKKAVGYLLKNKVIEQKSDGIYLGNDLRDTA